MKWTKTGQNFANRVDNRIRIPEPFKAGRLLPDSVTSRTAYLGHVQINRHLEAQRGEY